MAANGIYFDNQPLLPIGNQQKTTLKSSNAATGKSSFAEALAKADSKIIFSQHAQQRMASRQLQLSSDDMAKLDDTVDKMAQKGAKESLIYLNDIALVVSVANKTVITAMDGTSAKENIFTNIDSAAIL